ncbi:MAG: hypothetical protein JWQ74_25 [Marmoricola sp.]|nr:hypothetical protein [Marmoricola sp.]
MGAAMGETDQDMRAPARDLAATRRGRALARSSVHTGHGDMPVVLGQGVVIPLPRRPETRPDTGPETAPQTHPGDDQALTWKQAVRPVRLLGRFVLGIAVGGVALGVALTATLQTPEALAVLVGSTIIAVLSWSVLTSSAPTTVTLAGSVLHVRRNRTDDYFDLAGPHIRMRVIGRPNRPNWQVRLENLEGSTAELGANQVDAPTVHAAVLRYCEGRRGL